MGQRNSVSIRSSAYGDPMFSRSLTFLLLLGAAFAVFPAPQASATWSSTAIPTAPVQDPDSGDCCPIPGDELTVVMTHFEPFVIDDDGDPDGFYAEIWHETAAELGVGYDVVWVDSFGDLLVAIEAGEADIAIAPLAPTAQREAHFDFTSAVISSGPQFGYHERIANRGGLLNALVSAAVVKILGVAFVGLIILAHLIWLVERNRGQEDGDFSRRYVRGVWDGFWWATVTVTTVGYGDKAPRSVGGRMVALLAMLLSLFVVGAFVSQVTDVLREKVGPPLTGLDDLGDRRVGVVAESSFAQFVEMEGAETVTFGSQREVFEAAEAGDVDVMVANPYALNLLGPEYGIRATGDVLYEEFETFGLAQDSPWREPINQVLADLQASGEIDEIVDRWLD